MALVLITGATDGIGTETAIALGKLGADVIVHGRSAERVARAAEAVRRVAAQGVSVHEAVGDLGSLASVRALADDLLRRFPKLDVLIANAGVFMNERVLSADGFEMTMAVNHLAHVLLIELLLPSLAAAKGRVVVVSSVAHKQGKVDPADPGGTAGFRPYDAYANSKLANVLFAFELAKRVKAKGITANALHPGVVSTKLLKSGFSMEGPDSLADGAATSVFLAVDPLAEGITGRYFSARKEATPSRLASDPTLASRFYEESLKAVGL